MKVLYIAEDYIYSKVHHLLCNSIVEAASRMDLTIYSVLRSNKKRQFDISGFFGEKEITILNMSIESRLKMYLYKYDFLYKRNVKYKWLKNNYNNLLNTNIVHAATLFSEGSVARAINKDYGIPYIVSVRGSDINFYFKYMLHLHKLGKDILNNAYKIVFITPKLRDNFFNLRTLRPIKNRLLEKSCVIPNGIEDFWLQNKNFIRNVIDPYSIIYIGRFDKNKNVKKLAKAVLMLQRKYKNIRLTMVGGGGCQHEQIIALCEKYPNVLNYVGAIYNEEKLCEIIRKHGIFAMVSHSETFGLVYVEALSQGLPVLYSLNQGIDGMFAENVGEKADSHSLKSIVSALDKLITNYSNYDSIENSINKFDWKTIANNYIKIYNSMSNVF